MPVSRAKRHPTTMLVLISATALAFLCCLSISEAAPKPKAVSAAWQLDFRFKDPQRLVLNVDGTDRPQTFWYIIYTITNNTGQDVIFHPEFELMTDTMQVLRANVGIDPVVFDTIRQLHRPTYPWLQRPTAVVGKILQGMDNARDSIAVWPDFDPNASSFDLFIAGLSGEITSVPNPLYDPNQPQKHPPRFVLRKTMKVRYCLPSEPATQGRAVPFRCGTPQVQWIMR